MERLRRAVIDASQRLERQSHGPRDSSGGLAPGDLYVFETPVEGMIEWLIVRLHPDDSTLVLFVPVDDFPIVGRSDVPLKPEFIDRPLTARCGEATWVPAAVCQGHLRVGGVPQEAIAEVGRKLAALARGQFTDSPAVNQVDADPEYLAWLEHVAIARGALEGRTEPRE
jgi:hypothetical protein